MNRHWTLWWLASLAVGAAFVALWQLVADLELVPAVFLPGPDRIWSALVQGLIHGNLLPSMLITIERMIVGWLAASVLGIVLGALIGMSPVARAYLQPTLEVLRPLPASAIIPLAISLLGLSEKMILAVIAFGALWPMLLATVHGFAAVEPSLFEVARTLGISRWAFVKKIALPSAMPDILSGLRLGLTVALILAVVGEMMTSRGGLGQWMVLSARVFRAPDMFAGVVLLGLIGFASTLLLGALESRMLRWRPRI